MTVVVFALLVAAAAAAVGGLLVTFLPDRFGEPPRERGLDEHLLELARRERTHVG